MNDNKENHSEEHLLSQVLHQSVDETLTQEQVQRVLNPLVERIDAGEFNDPKPQDLAQRNRVNQSYKISEFASFLDKTSALIKPSVDTIPKKEGTENNNESK